MKWKTYSLIISLLLIASCSGQNSTFTVVCTSDEREFHDNTLTFDLNNMKVLVKKTLTQYGHEQKMLMQKVVNTQKFIEEWGEEKAQEYLDIFDEIESTKYIRSVSDGMIVFGTSLEADDFFDIYSNFDRANLQLKEVMKMDKSIIGDTDFKTDTVNYFDCKLPKV